MPLDVSLSAGLPSAMVGRGILALHSAYVLMWRPWCMAHLSSHARAAGAPTSVTWQRHELVELEGHVVIHRELTRRGKRVLVLSYADLLWDGSRTLRRLEAFLPCAGKLSRSFLPRQGVDVFGNDWKVKKNVQTYSVEHSSEDSGFDVRLGRCTDLNLYDPLMHSQLSTSEDVNEYGLRWFVDEPVAIETGIPVGGAAKPGVPEEVAAQEEEEPEEPEKQEG